MNQPALCPFVRPIGCPVDACAFRHWFTALRRISPASHDCWVTSQHSNSNSGAKAVNKKLKWSIGIVAIAGLIAGGVFAAKAMTGNKAEAKPEGPPMLQFTPNEIATVRKTSLPVELQASGVLSAERSATVRAKTSAVITSLTVQEGEAVKAGQVLAVLDNTELLQRVAAQEGSMAAAQARLIAAKKARDQQQSLFNQQYISQTALDTAQSGFDAAAGDARAAQAQVAIAKQTLGDAVVRSPLNGVVAKRLVQTGEKVSFDSPLLQIVDLSSLELQSWVLPDALSQLQPGRVVKVQVSGVSTPIKATIKRVLPVADAATRQIGVVIAIPNPTREIKVGLQATARIVLENRDALTVPVSAVADNAGVTSVWIASAKDANTKGSSTGDFTVKRMPVNMGLRDDAMGVVHVSSAEIKEGDIVLSGRYDGLKDGQVVKFVSGTEPAKPAASASVAAANTASK